MSRAAGLHDLEHRRPDDDEQQEAKHVGPHPMVPAELKVRQAEFFFTPCCQSSANFSMFCCLHRFTVVCCRLFMPDSACCLLMFDHTQLILADAGSCWLVLAVACCGLLRLAAARLLRLAPACCGLLRHVLLFATVMLGQ